MSTIVLVQNFCLVCSPVFFFQNRQPLSGVMIVCSRLRETGCLEQSPSGTARKKITDHFVLGAQHDLMSSGPHTQIPLFHNKPSSHAKNKTCLNVCSVFK